MKYLVISDGRIEWEGDDLAKANDFAESIVEEMRLEAARDGEWIGDEHVAVCQVLTEWEVEDTEDGFSDIQSKEYTA